MRISDWSSDVCSSDLRENPADLQSAAIDRSATRPWGLASRGGVFGERSLACQRAWQQKAAHGSQTCFPTLPCPKSSSLLGTSCRGGGARQSYPRCASAVCDAQGCPPTGDFLRA